MSPNTTGAQIAHDRVDRFRPFGAFGKPAWQNHVQLRAMLMGRRGPDAAAFREAANYFARPTFDPDAGELRWHAEVSGSARAWSSLGDEERAALQPKLDALRSRLLSFVHELRSQSAPAPAAGQAPGGGAAFASLLEQAMKVPDGHGDEYLFVVGEQPVIAWWGFENHDGTSVDPAVHLPRAAAPMAAAPAAAAVAAAPMLEDKKKRPWWWWLLWALLALLLLALLLGLWRGCTPTATMPPPGASAPGALPDGARPPGSTPDTGALGPGGTSPGATGLPGTEPGPVALGPDGKALPVVPGASGAELGSLPGAKDMPRDGNDAPKPGTDPLAPKDGQEPKDKQEKKDAKDPKDALDPKGPKDPKDPNKSDRGNTQPPKLPEIPDPKSMKLPEDPAKPDPKNPNAPKPGIDPKTGQPKLDFLEGDWKVPDPLTDKRTQKPVDLGFKFDKDGKGEMSVRRDDGSVCKGPVQGRMQGGKLGIEGNQTIPCPGGGSFPAPRVECQKERNGQTACYGINPDGSRYYMDMQKK